LMMNRYLRPILLLSLILLILIGVFRWTGGREDLSIPAAVLFETAGCLQKAITTSTGAVESFWEEYFFLVNAREENKQLKENIHRLGTEINRLHEDGLANRRLMELLDFKMTSELPVLGARVIAWDPNAWFKSITIDRGSSDGIKNGMPVVTSAGVVGRIIGLTPNFAKVMLVIDYNSGVDVLVQRSRVQGIMAGRSADICHLKYVLKHDDLKKGDVLITSGLGGFFPKGLKAGSISKITAEEHGVFLEVEVEPIVDFKKLEEVLVILREENLL